MNDEQEDITLDLPDKVTITIEDPDVIEVLSSGQSAIVNITEVHKMVEFVKSNMFADSSQELEEDFNFNLVPLNIEKID